ncbi:hypothetical protein CYMTET_25076 [Cymbomonas tetramitiformis]|uniref:Uncharacterized protein n=1 Tax=Cymbomonas tetramitiformis TaxID=36881 RepID=A0AAE0FW20_9CHLO|nr:hypothetical protein CYMTET_25076 [Cymbomonas tetramitiformis]
MGRSQLDGTLKYISDGMQDPGSHPRVTQSVSPKRIRAHDLTKDPYQDLDAAHLEAEGRRSTSRAGGHLHFAGRASDWNDPGYLLGNSGAMPSPASSRSVVIPAGAAKARGKLERLPERSPPTSAQMTDPSGGHAHPAHAVPRNVKPPQRHHYVAEPHAAPQDHVQHHPWKHAGVCVQQAPQSAPMICIASQTAPEESAASDEERPPWTYAMPHTPRFTSSLGPTDEPPRQKPDLVAVLQHSFSPQPQTAPALPPSAPSRRSTIQIGDRCPGRQSVPTSSSPLSPQAPPFQLLSSLSPQAPPFQLLSSLSSAPPFQLLSLSLLKASPFSSSCLPQAPPFQGSALYTQLSLFSSLLSTSSFIFSNLSLPLASPFQLLFSTLSTLSLTLSPSSFFLHLMSLQAPPFQLLSTLSSSSSSPPPLHSLSSSFSPLKLLLYSPAPPL